MRFDGIVPVHESDQFNLAVRPMLEDRLAVPHLHQCPDYPFCLAVRSGRSHLGESLFNSMRLTALHQGMIAAYSSLEKSSMPINRYSLAACGVSPSSSGSRFVSRCAISPGYSLL